MLLQKQPGLKGTGVVIRMTTGRPDGDAAGGYPLTANQFGEALNLTFLYP